MVTMQTWQEQMSEDMRLCDFRPRTQEGYAAAVRQFMDWAQRAPSRLTDEHIRAYFLYLREEKKLAPSTINIAVHALRFFFRHTVQSDCKVFDLLRVNKPRVLPVVLSRGEVRTVLGAVRHPVTFRYRDSRDHRRKSMSLPAHEFLRRFLQHVLPRGLHRVRAFGLHPAHRATLRQLQLTLAPRETEQPARAPRLRLPCPHCGRASLRLVRRLSPGECAELASALAAGRAGQPLARAPP